MSWYYPNDDAGVSVRCASVAAGVMRGANVQPGFIQPGLRGGRSPATIGGGGGEGEEGGVA